MMISRKVRQGEVGVSYSFKEGFILLQVTDSEGEQARAVLTSKDALCVAGALMQRALDKQDERQPNEPDPVGEDQAWNRREPKCPKCGDRILVHPPTGQRACRNPKCRYLFKAAYPSVLRDIIAMGDRPGDLEFEPPIGGE